MGVEEALEAPSELGSDLQAGVEAISSNQTITFTKYIRLVLPLDGYVFWVKADLLSESALYNAARIGSVRFNEPPGIEVPAKTIVAQGSIHYATETRQDETETYGVNRVVFTSQQEIQDLNQVNPQTLYIGEWQGVRFAFSTRGSFYKQSALWHYVGNAIYSDMATQVVDSLAGLNRELIVSNSLPIWLSLNGLASTIGLVNPVTLYPSFLLPNNLLPPYGAVHIDNTRAIASAPFLSSTLSHSQLVQERVKVTLYGLRNAPSLDFLDFVLQYSVDNDVLGIMNQPIVQDEKRTQSELGTIAQKKVIEFEVNYLQSSVRDVARKLILRAVPNFIIDGQLAA